MNLLQRSSQTLRAAELIRHGFKTNIVVQDTGLSSNTIRTLYKEVQGQSPKAGQLPSPASILSTTQALLHASIFMAHYTKHIESNSEDRVDINLLIQAYNRYRRELKKWNDNNVEESRLLSVNDSWVLARGLVAKLVQVHLCSSGHFYISTPKQRTLPICPFCKSHQH
ncbi:FlhC family transcriptional regulator [Parashewanella tropica]|uniref:FlhC family transcriptional regulator n=1 Tax=Parashewanella tropica TaxID=2547970 RepID=UPI0010595D08|nr:FlhC family transcriptional regulator [Parashewanella tropica]